ncbi:ABC transporter permease [Canibacter zhoujuaniae]|uniref:ABC transporter permease n=1 Tax=Canibacter zhoujuaniae TaxID=2708343 RepID=UPI00141F08F8|nr:ABC transporter permease [Canibacter zhoujuaniae]
MSNDQLGKLGSGVKKALTSSILLSILSAFAVGAVLLLLTGANPIDGYRAMLEGALGTGLGLANTIARATTIICFALAIAVAFRAGVLNLGTEGQAVLGALTGGLVALYMPGPGFLVLLASLATAIITGAAWGYLAAFLQNVLNVPILISTLLLNYPARFYSSWLIRFKLDDPTTDLSASAQIAPDRLLQTFVVRGSDQAKELAAAYGGQSYLTAFLTNVNWGLVLVIALLAGIIFLNSRTRYGFESGLAGQNAEFTRYAGVQPSRLTTKTMLLSGGIAGLAGVMLVLGAPNTRMLEGHVVTTGYAWTALLVTLLAAYRPLGTAISGLFFAAIIVGAAAMGRELGLSPQISAIIQALVIILIAFKVAIPKRKRRSEKRTEVTA